MEDKKDNSRQLIFLESVSMDTNAEQLVERIILKLESFGFNIFGRDEEQKDEN